MTTLSYDDSFSLDSLIALPFDRAAKLAGISTWRLNHWDTSRVVVASIRRRVGKLRPIRLYTLADLEGLMSPPNSVAEFRCKRSAALSPT